MIEVMVNGQWVEGKPNIEGQRFRETTEIGAVIEGTYRAKQYPRKITKLAFKQRFTQEERIALRQAAQGNALVEDYLDLLESATYVDLVREDGAAAALPQLESLGLLAEGRTSQILSAPIQEHERWSD